MEMDLHSDVGRYSPRRQEIEFRKMIGKCVCGCGCNNDTNVARCYNCRVADIHKKVAK